MYKSIPWDEIHVPRFLAIGTCLTLAESAALYPIDVVRARLQCDTNPVRGQWSAVWNCFRNTWKTEGTRALYQGFWWDSVMSLPSSVVYIVSYNMIKEYGYKRAEEYGVKQELLKKTIVPLLAGASAEITCAVFDNPIDVVVQRLQIAKRSANVAVPTGLQLFRQIYREEGWRGFYRGLTSSFLTNIPSSALWWPSYEVSKTLLAPIILRIPFNPQDSSTTDSRTAIDAAREHALHATSGFLAGFQATVFTNPLDVVKTRVQTKSETYGTSNPFRCVALIAKNEGLAALGKGLIPRLAYSIPASSVAAFSYELALGWSRKMVQKSENWV